MLRSAGIRSLAQLKRLGAVKAYVKVRAVDQSASLNLLSAPEAALSGRAWQHVAKNDRLRLLLAVEGLFAVQSENRKRKGNSADFSPLQTAWSIAHMKH